VFINLERLGNSQREVFHLQALVLGGRPVRGASTKERLHLNASELVRVAVPERKALNGPLAVAIDDQLQLAVRLADVVKLCAFGNGDELSLGEAEGATSDASAVHAVAVAVRHSGAEVLIARELGAKARVGEVSVDFTLSIGAPHETSGVAVGCTSATGAALGILVAVATIDTGELSAPVEVEVGIELDLVGQGHFFCVGKVHGLRVEAKAAGAGAFVRPGAGLEVDFESIAREDGRSAGHDAVGLEGVHGKFNGTIDDTLGS